MAKVITGGAVNLTHPETFELVTLVPGDTVPKWALELVTNPALFEKREASDETGSQEPPAPPAGEEPPATSTPPATTEAPSTPEEKPFVIATKIAELREQAKTLGLDESGTKADLKARIEAKIAEKPAEPAAAGADATEADQSGTDRASLEARADALGIEVESEYTDEEIIALIEAAQE